MPVCPACGHEGSMRFCPDCGQPMARRCPACGALCDAQMRFCGDCGTRFEAAPGTAQEGPAGGRSIGEIGMVRGNVDQSVHSTTNIGTSISGSVGSLHIVQQPQAPTAPELRRRGQECLRAHLYSDAAEAFQEAAALADDADTHFYLALAGFCGRRPKLLSLSAIHAIEDHLATALRLDASCHHARVLWAIVKQDYYVMNRMFERPPTAAQLVAQCGPVSRERVREILAHVDAPGNAILDGLRHG